MDHTGETVNKACPQGWHLPSDAEWTELEDYITNDGHSGVEGTALKATRGWSSGGNGKDNYGFSALPGGDRDDDSGAFSDAGYYGYWWSSTEYNRNLADFRILYYGFSNVPHGLGYKLDNISVRCLRD